MYTNDEVEVLKGKTLVECKQVDVGQDEVHFVVSDDEAYKLTHYQDCCESVYLAEVIGDLDDLVGAELVEAEEVAGESGEISEWGDSCTWTFYKFRTRKGSVTLRWCGESNGYYSESVDFTKI